MLEIKDIDAYYGGSRRCGHLDAGQRRRIGRTRRTERRGKTTTLRVISGLLPPSPAALRSAVNL